MSPRLKAARLETEKDLEEVLEPLPIPAPAGLEPQEAPILPAPAGLELQEVPILPALAGPVQPGGRPQAPQVELIQVQAVPRSHLGGIFENFGLKFFEIWPISSPSTTTFSPIPSPRLCMAKLGGFSESRPLGSASAALGCR